jgi:hypothetical protein
MILNVYRYARIEHRKVKAWKETCRNWRNACMDAEEKARRLKEELDEARAVITDWVRLIPE